MANVGSGEQPPVIASVQESQLPSSTVSSFLNSSSFADSVILLPNAPVLSSAQRHLNTLFETEKCQIEAYTDEHWKTPEFPLARIKKIMRIDEDVKMISGEVPVLLSKAIELFVTELTLRSWILTEDNKRRTVQRSDIAMAIAKNDMFDFLIDIVPREEISSRNKSDASVGLSSSPMSPELIQLYLHLMAQQSDTQSSETTSSTEEDGTKKTTSDDEPGQTTNIAMQQTLAANAILQQQIQLIQQIAQLQQQISKSPVTSSNTVSNSASLPASSSSAMDTSLTEHSQPAQSFGVATTTSLSTGNSALLDTVPLVASSDLLPQNPLISVTPFLMDRSHLTLPASTSSMSSSSVSDMSDPGVQRFVINPGGIVESSGLQTLSNTANIGQSGLSLGSLHPESSSGFGPDLTGTLSTSGIFDSNENNK